MILEFSVANFFSFKERVTFSMLANATEGLNDNFVLLNNKKILKTAAIYGANASGKSNLFKILSLVILMLRNSSQNDINAKLPIVPFKLDSKTVDEPSEFEIKFVVEDIKYVYGFLADQNKIYEEYLYYYPNGRETKIFDRTNVDFYSFSQKDEKVLKDIQMKTSANKFFLSTATNWNFEKTKKAYEFLTFGMGTCFNLEELKNMSLNEYVRNDETLKQFALEFLKKTDFSIEDFKVSKIDLPAELLSKMPKTQAFQVLFKHKGSDVYLSFDEESIGTQMVFSFIPFISDSLHHKKVLIIDELDRSLHPFLVHYIVEMFNDPDVNKSGSQLIFNTHDTNLLDLNILRRDQIWFTEKEQESGISTLYCLADFSVRKSENVEKGYLLGRYGAVPFIKNDWNLWSEK